MWQLYLQSSWGLLKSPEEWFCFTIHLAVHAFDILTCNPGYTESLDSFPALLCSAFTRGAAPWWNPKEGKVEAGGKKKMWIKLLLGFFVHFSNSETPLTVPVSSHQPYIQSSSHPQYSFSCWCWPQLDTWHVYWSNRIGFGFWFCFLMYTMFKYTSHFI